MTEINAGNVKLANEWRLYFLKEQVKVDNKKTESIAKQAVNKANSADVLAPIIEAKRLVEYGKWLNTAGNIYRKENFNKKYTQQSVNAFLAL